MKVVKLVLDYITVSLKKTWKIFKVLRVIYVLLKLLVVTCPCFGDGPGFETNLFG